MSYDIGISDVTRDYFDLASALGRIKPPPRTPGILMNKSPYLVTQARQLLG